MLRYIGTVLAVMSLLSLLLTTPVGAQTYTVIDLGQVNVGGINVSGQVCGAYGVGGRSHAYLWTNGVVSDMDVPKGFTDSFGLAVNGFGHVAGYAVTSTYVTHAALWKNGKSQDLGTLTKGNRSLSYAYGVNDSDQVVGLSGHAFLWTAASGMVDLGTLGGTSSVAYGINTNGHVVGMAHNASGQARPYLWLPAHANGTSCVMQSLGGLPGGDGLGWARAINNSDQIVGFSDAVPTPLGTPSHAFLYQSSAMQDLGILPGGFNSDAKSINQLGTIVGNADIIDPSGTSTTNHAAIWQSGQTTPTDLNSLIPAGSGWFLSDAVSVNDAGWILGTGTLNGVAHAFLLTPQ